jgi:nitronate monooxygenase
MSFPSTIRRRMALPLIAAPMFRVSGPDLVVATCRNGVVGAFPTANCRTIEELDDWLAREFQLRSARTTRRIAPTSSCVATP